MRIYAKRFVNKLDVNYLSKRFYLSVYSNAPIKSQIPININYFIIWSLVLGKLLINKEILSDTHF